MNTAQTENTAPTKKKNWTLIALLTVTILPIAAAYTMFYTGMGVPDNTVNNGVLLPKAIKLQDLLAQNEPDFVQALHTEKKWRLLLPITAECNAACEQNLYTTRQVHIRLSEKSVRVERVAVNIGGTVGQRIYDEIKSEHPKLKMLTADADKWQTWLAQAEAGLNAEQVPFYLLIDQEGFAMMSYTNKQHGNELLKDIKRALKYSIDYQ